MTIYEFADMIGAQISVTRFPSQKERWIARFGCCDVKEGAVLKGEYGEGRNAIEAIENYIMRIKGTKIVLHAESPEYRSVYNVPDSLSSGELHYKCHA